MLMFQTCVWKLARYNGITMLPFGRAIAVHGSLLDALRSILKSVHTFVVKSARACTLHTRFALNLLHMIARDIGIEESDSFRFRQP